MPNTWSYLINCNLIIYFLIALFLITLIVEVIIIYTNTDVFMFILREILPCHYSEKLSLRNCGLELQLLPSYVHVLRIIALNGFPFELHESRSGTIIIALSVWLQQISCW